MLEKVYISGDGSSPTATASIISELTLTIFMIYVDVNAAAEWSMLFINGH